ncbi:MAG TPA: DinB family protein [Thermomicrobiales bacterium]|nr:DinB family protein [Thermomicrobiales bacterium]
MDPVVATVVRLYKEAHAEMREAVRGLDAKALSWQPAPETNSIAVLIVHTLGSEAEVFRIARNAAGSRDRDAEFRTPVASADELIGLLDAADADLDAAAPRITAADVDAERPRRTNPPETMRYWMIQNYGHAREHLAQIHLTKQLYEAQAKGVEGRG